MTSATDTLHTPMIGHPLSRIEGPLKVTGAAHYTADFAFPSMVHAVPLGATVARGKLLDIDVSVARDMPGVHAVFTHHTIGRLYRIGEESGVSIDEKRPPMQDDVIRYYGQYVALVVADTFEQASAAAQAIVTEYASEVPDVRMALQADDEPEVDEARGDAPTAFAKGEVSIDHTYTTPPETHNPIELHATVACYDGRDLTLFETSQAIVNHKGVLVQMLGMAPENVRVVTEYLGSGFGGKLWPWTHSLLAAAAARALKRPVKLEISRKMMFQTVGHRTNTQQRIRLSADRHGKLNALMHDFIYHLPREDGSKENCGEATGYLYSTPNLRVTSASAKRDIAPNTSMRGPGAVPGLYALESGMDELALALDMCPLQLRLVNEPLIDESMGAPFSTRHMKECLTVGAERFGWNKRSKAAGSMRDGDEIIGWGLACASWMAKRIPAEAAIRISQDGRVRLSCATQDLGTGTYTVLAQMVSSATGLPVSRIDIVIGDTALPSGPMSGGSMATGSLVPAVLEAAKKAVEQLIAIATAKDANTELAGVDPKTVIVREGALHYDAGGISMTFDAVLAAAQMNHVDGQGKSGSSDKDSDAKKRAIHSYGAHFVEVGWRPEIARLRVRRVVTVIDAGKIINPKTGRNQIEGAIVMGVGMAMLEQTEYDPQNGAPMNSNLADYMMVTHADSPDIDVTFLDYPDLALNEIGARGIGEIGLAGVAAAITAAVHHATGVRVRDLPVMVEDLLTDEV